MIATLKSTLIILTLHILDLLQESSGQKPLILHKASEVLINAGDTIEFECIDTREIFFFFPEYHKEDGQKTISTHAEPSESEANGVHIYKYSRNNAAPTDTGWYGCANHDVTDIPEAIYHSNDIETSSVENYKKTVISEIYNDPEVNWIYFYVASPNSSFVEEDEMRIITGIESYTAIVPCRPTSPDLEVILYNEDEGEVVELGGNISYDPKFGFKFNNCTEEDSGHFSCNMTRNDIEYKISYHLHVRRLSYITLKTLETNLDRHDEKAVLNATVYGFPEPKLQWFAPSGDAIISDLASRHLDPKYAIDTTLPYTALTIYGLDAQDTGTYKLLATNDNLEISLIFTLEVLFEPSVVLEGVSVLHPLGQSIEIECNVEAYPPPSINMSFLRNQHILSSEIFSLVELTSTTEEVTSDSFISKASFTSNVSGTINCTACNSEGCDFDEIQFVAIDNDAMFKILEPKEPIIEGDSISIVCVASKFFYTNNINWTKGLDVPIEESERISIFRQDTSLSFLLKLIIREVRKEDEDIYTCSVHSEFIDVDLKTYNLTVYDRSSPFFTSTNLQGNNININLGRERYNTSTLKCYVGGFPKPNVTWYKDGVILDKNGHYLFLHEDQELRINFLEEGNGNYSCRATNRLGTIEDFVTITIKGKGLSKGIISTIVILLIIVLFLTVFFTISLRREKILRKELIEAGLLNFEEGLLENLNPDLSINDQAELLPYDKKWEFPREQLKLGKHLGSGAFGVVMKAEAVGICKDEKITTVAVKMVRPTSDLTYIRALASELKIMVHLGKHLNVVNLLGACTKNILKRELFVIVEYCRYGNLHSYLLRHRAVFINQIDPATDKFDSTIGSDRLMRTISRSSQDSDRINDVELPYTCNISTYSDTETLNYEVRYTSDSQDDTISTVSCTLSNNSPQPGWRSNYRGDYKDENLKPICSQDLLSWAFQVARGMEYLSQRKVLHCDLAARNVLLTEDNVVKICDFGLAKTVYKDDNYKKKGDEPLPVKWMAIESIRDAIFSAQSDVWSFGIVLWEFFTLAETPYHGMAFEELYQKLRDGYRMEQPIYATSDIYKIMLLCWNAEPTLRPCFTELVNCIADLLEGSVKALYISLNIPYMNMNAETLAGKIDYLTMQSSPDYTTSLSSSSDFVQRQDTKEEVEIDASNDRDSI